MMILEPFRLFSQNIKVHLRMSRPLSNQFLPQEIWSRSVARPVGSDFSSSQDTIVRNANSHF